MADSAPVLIWIADPTRGARTATDPGSTSLAEARIKSTVRAGLTQSIPTIARVWSNRTPRALPCERHFASNTGSGATTEPTDGSWTAVPPITMPSGRFVGFIGSSIDISDQHEAESRLTQRAIKQAALAGFGRFALAQHSSEELMKEATRLICDTLRDVDLSQVFSLADDTGTLVLKAATGMDPGRVDLATGRHLAADRLHDGFFTLADNAEAFPWPPRLTSGQSFVAGLAVAISTIKSTVRLCHGPLAKSPCFQS